MQPPPPAPPPPYLVPLILIAFPMVFVGMWSFVCAILAFTSGYRTLVPTYVVDESTVRSARALPTPWFAMIGWVSYRGGALALRTDADGLVLRVSSLFPFHPPVRIPWSRVHLPPRSASRLGRGLFGSTIMLDGRLSLRIPDTTYDAIVAAHPAYAHGASPSPTGR